MPGSGLCDLLGPLRCQSRWLPFGMGFLVAREQRRRAASEGRFVVFYRKSSNVRVPPANGEWRCGLSVFKGTAR